MPFRRATATLMALALAACAQPTAPTSCPLAKVAAFPVTIIGHNLPMIVIDIDGHPKHMLVDTGAGNSLLMPAAYENLRGMPLTRFYGVYGVGAGGDMGVDTAILEDLQIGNVNLKDEGLFVVNFGNFRVAPGQPRVDGLLGFDVLQDFDVAFDLPNHLITLYDPQSCASGETPWVGDYDSEPFVLRADRLNEPDIAIDINGKPMTLLLDSGAGSSLVAARALVADGLTPEAVSGTQFHGLGVGNLAFAYHRERFASVTIGAETFSDLWLRVGNIAATRIRRCKACWGKTTSHITASSSPTPRTPLILVLPCRHRTDGKFRMI